MSSSRSFASYSETRVKSAVMSGAGTLSQGSFDNYLKDPLGRTSRTAEPELSLADQIRSIRLNIIRRIYDLLRKVYGMDQGALADYTAEAVSGGNAVWTRVDSVHYYHEESEDTTFETVGTVRTSDGRSIDFGVSLSMSRSFKCVYEGLAAREYFATDPLVNNVDGGITGISDQKFYFDLDGDGTEENISFARKGSGFLALDLNEDGVINDGSELFGTKSGNGFADLAEYDLDNNGWIDEADEVFDRLKVWVKEDDGTDKLLSLKEADVGAIYLGYAPTHFTLNSHGSEESKNITGSGYNNRALAGYEMNLSPSRPDAYGSALSTGIGMRPDAYIRSHGVFLKESGGVGTIAQVDMVS